MITCWSSKTDQTYTWGLGHYTGDNPIVKNFRGFDDETALITDWLKWFDKQAFDLWSGWNSKLFDVPYIVNRIKNIREKLGIEKPIENKLSPVAKAPIKQDVTDRLTGSKRGETYEIPGLLHHDYMDLYVTFAKHDPLPSYSLNYVTNLELGEGKLEYEGTINTIYKENFNLFTEYNVQDVLLLVKLEKKLKLFALIIEYAYDCVTTLDKVFQKVPTTEGYILKFIHKQNKLMNDRKDHHTDWWHNEECYKVTTNGQTYYQNCYWEDGKFSFDEFAIKAGYCYDFPGRYDNCMSFDITSSYPHHIMQFNISPEVKVIHPTLEQINSGEVIPTDINELGFKRTTDAILPNLVKMVFDERKHYKDLKKQAHKDGNKDLEDLYDARQGVKKIIINSMYGVCLTSSFHLYDIDCARAITRCARVTLRDWLSKSINDYYPTKGFIGELEKEFGLTFKDKTPLVCKNRDVMAVHNDTDSVYLCFNEAIERLVKEGVSFNTEDEKRGVYQHIENILQNFFNKVLEIRAAKSKTTNKIKFNRENIFSNMFCFAKKLYIGAVIDSEGDKYPFTKPKHKIMGVPIKRSDAPDFCKEADEKLAFDICAGQGYEDSKKFIIKAFEEFKQQKLEEICGRKSISDYNKYVTEPIEKYVQEGFNYQNIGGIFQSKVSLAYNYIIAKHKLPYTPIVNGTKFNYLYVKPNNRNNIEAIAFIGKWPKEFNEMFEIDYELMFRKTFLPVIESMFKVKKWIGEKDTIDIEDVVTLDGFFE